MSQATDSIVIIPARGGSKGIPGKNIKPLWKKPLVAYSIESALEEGFAPDNIILSSDDAKILEVGNSYGISAQLRPAELAGDTVSTEAVLLYHLNEMLKIGKLPEFTILLQPTSPLRRSGRVRQALDFCKQGAYDSVVSVTPFHGFIWSQKAGVVVSDYQPVNRPRRQEMEGSKFLENGSIYVTKSQGLIENRSRLFGKIGLYVLVAHNAALFGRVMHVQRHAADGAGLLAE
jgi:N-acylneuraminate cytidylyltransferase